MAQTTTPLLTMEQAAQMVAAERERWLKAATAALEVLDELSTWSNAGHACKLLRDAQGPNGQLTGQGGA